MSLTFSFNGAAARRISLGFLLCAASVWQALAAEPAKGGLATAAKSADVKELFNGKSLEGWTITDFAGHGEVTVERNFRAGTNAPSPAIIMEMGAALTGIHWTNSPPNGEYELSLEALKIEGSDFFCGLTFPVGDGHCSFIVGGWGGGLVGISSVDGMDASENETTKFRSFDKNRWYKIRVRVTKKKLEAWIDEEQLVDLDTRDRKMTVRAGEIELSQPLGVASFQTRAAIRNVRLQLL